MASSSSFWWCSRTYQALPWTLRRALRLEGGAPATPKRRKGSQELAPPGEYEMGSTVEDAIFLPLLFSCRMRFTFLVYLSAAVTSLHAEKPFDFANTPGKLPKQVRPTEYAIWVKPDLQKLTFAGHETVKMNVEQPTREIILNALDLTISEAEFDGKAVPKTKFDAKN